MSEELNQVQPGWIDQLPDETVSSVGNQLPTVSPSGPDFPALVVKIIFRPDSSTLFRHTLTHWGFRDILGGHVDYQCGQVIGQDCIGCNLANEIKAASNRARKCGDADAVEVFTAGARALRPAEYYLYEAVTDEAKHVALKLRPRHAEELHACLRSALANHGFDPLSTDGGAWLVLNRSGAGRETRYHARFATQSDGQIKRAEIDSGVLAKVLSSTPDLLKSIPSATPEMIGEVKFYNEELRAAVVLMKKFEQ